MSISKKNNYIFILVSMVFVALLIKDASYLGDQYILRGFSQGLALIAGIMWYLFNINSINYKQYSLLFVLILVIWMSTFAADKPVFVALQAGSLTASLLIFLAYSETLQSNGDQNNDKFIKLIFLASSAVCVISFILLKIKPDLVYWVNAYDGTKRFSGLFGQPAMMGVTAGILLGLSVFIKINVLPRIIFGLLAAICLFLTSSRTFWIAAIASLIITMWWRSDKKYVLVLFVLLSALVLTISSGLVEYKMDKSTNKLLRPESINNLSGRTVVWDYGFKKFLDRPYLGYGFTSGDTGFKAKLDKKSYTLHNGYIQSLLDIGIFGFLLYLATVIIAIVKIYRNKSKQLAASLYCLLFLSISNLGESIMFSASTYSSLLAWYFVVFGLSLRANNKHSESVGIMNNIQNGIVISGNGTGKI